MSFWSSHTEELFCYRNLPMVVKDRTCCYAKRSFHSYVIYNGVSRFSYIPMWLAAFTAAVSAAVRPVAVKQFRLCRIPYFWMLVLIITVITLPDETLQWVDTFLITTLRSSPPILSFLAVLCTKALEYELLRQHHFLRPSWKMLLTTIFPFLFLQLTPDGLDETLYVINRK